MMRSPAFRPALAAGLFGIDVADFQPIRGSSRIGKMPRKPGSIAVWTPCSTTLGMSISLSPRFTFIENESPS